MKRMLLVGVAMMTFTLVAVVVWLTTETMRGSQSEVRCLPEPVTDPVELDEPLSKMLGVAPGSLRYLLINCQITLRSGSYRLGSATIHLAPAGDRPCQVIMLMGQELTCRAVTGETSAGRDFSRRDIVLGLSGVLEAATREFRAPLPDGIYDCRLGTSADGVGPDWFIRGDQAAGGRLWVFPAKAAGDQPDADGVPPVTVP
jgi:hypothetical protein